MATLKEQERRRWQKHRAHIRAMRDLAPFEGDIQLRRRVLRATRRPREQMLPDVESICGFPGLD